MKSSKDTATKFWQNIVSVINVIGIVVTIWLLILAYRKGLFTSETALRDFLARTGSWAPIIFFFIQIAQTVIAAIPGAITIPLGTVIFGDLWGFILNISGIFIGSMINFWLARRFGTRIVRILVGEDNYRRGLSWLNRGEKRFENILIFLLIIPFTPGDLLCYIAGLTTMTYKKFFWTVIVGKPFNVWVYSYATLYLLKFVSQLFA